MSYGKIGSKARETMQAFKDNNAFCGASPKYVPRDGYGLTSTIICGGGIMYLMGRHFPLVVAAKDAEGKPLYVINGDKYGTLLTSRYQREAISMFKPNVQIPFSALIAAHASGKTSESIARRIASGEIEIVCAGADEIIHTGMVWTRVDGRYSKRPLAATDDPRIEITEHRLGAVLLRFGLEGWGRLADGSYAQFDPTPRLYLSDWDELESEHYFLTQLPLESKASTIAEAYASLVPVAVAEAQAQGVPVARQGDIFFVKAAEFKARGAMKAKPQIYSSSHHASAARMRDGAVYVRGSVRHLPEHQGARHKRLSLAGGWWQAVKNTATGSWEASGNVD